MQVFIMFSNPKETQDDEDVLVDSSKGGSGASRNPSSWSNILCKLMH